MDRINKLTKSTMALVIFALIGKVMGFVRQSLLAYYFGAGIETDAYTASLKATSLLSMIVSNAIAYTFIPMLAKVEEEEGRDRINYHTNNMLMISVVAAAIMTSIGIFAAPFIIKIVGGGFNQVTFDLTVQLTKIGMPAIIFSAIVGVMTGYLQSNGRFAATGALPILLNTVYISYLLFLSSTFGIYGMSVASVLGIVAQAIFLFPSTKRAGMKYFPVFNLNDKYVIHALELSVPVLLSVAINDVNIIVNTRLASGLESGTVTWLDNANKLNLLVLGVFVSAITAVVFPILSKHFSSGDTESGRKSMAASVRLILLITIPTMVGLIVLARPIVEIAFFRGEYTAYDVEMTIQTLRFYAPALTAMSLNILLNRVYYSLQDTKTPLLMGALSVTTNVILNLILIRFLQHRGLALGLSIATNISVFVSFIILRKKLTHIHGFTYLRAIIKNGVAAAIMGVVAYFGYFGVIALVPFMASRAILKLVVLLFSVLISMITYGLLSYAFGVGEVKMGVDMIKSRLGK